MLLKLLMRIMLKFLVYLYDHKIIVLILGIVNHVHENPLELCKAIADKILQNGKALDLRLYYLF